MGQIRVPDAILDELCAVYGKPIRRGFAIPIKELCAEVRRLRVEVNIKN